jgi:S-(hydroxymethyl)glutathione dehydrogenase/alcohol dehydrogenase
VPKSVVFRGKGIVEVTEVNVRQPGPGELRVTVAASGVCHSDLNFIQAAGDRLLDPPVVLGHEASAVVLEAGPGVTGRQPGDHVILTMFPQCGECSFCLAGQPTLCTSSPRSGAAATGAARLTAGGQPLAQFANMGAWSTETVVAADAAVRIDPDVPLVPAALLGCGVLTGFGAVAQAGQLRAGDSMAVLGCGGVGLHAVQAGRIRGAGRVIAVDTNWKKLALAERLGATDVVNVTDGDAIEQVRELTGGLGVDLSLDFVGIPSTVSTAIGMSRRGGRTVLTGLVAPAYEVTRDDIVRGARTITGNYLGMARFDTFLAELVRLYRSGALVLDELVTQRLTIHDTGKAFRAMEAGEVARSVLVLQETEA